MARRIKTSRKRTRKKTPFLPESLQAFIARRVIDVTGIVFALAGAGTLLALISYDHRDPSLNTASAIEESIHNWIGTPGAYISDLLLQTLGLGGAVFGLIAAIWGYRLLKRYPLRPFWLRLIMLVPAAVLLSVALARIPSGGWLVHPWLGGSGGTLILDKLAGLLHGLAGGWEHTIIALIAGIIGLCAFAIATGISWKEWKYLAAACWGWLCYAAETCAALAFSFADWVGHYNNPDITKPKRRPPKINLPKAPRKAPPVSSEEPEETLDPPLAGQAPAIHVSIPARKSSNVQGRFNLGDASDWELPPVDLLQEAPPDITEMLPDESALRKNAEFLQSVLADFNIQGEIVSIHPGPVVTLYELEPAPGTKTSRVISLSDDIARSMSAVSVRCAVVPGRNVIGIELPNSVRQTVYLRELLTTRESEKTHAKLPLILGKDIGGQPIIADLSKMPHLLVAGTTGSGKSVAINTMILSLLYRLPPEKCRFIMIDPKMLELSVYDDIPHLLSPVVTEPGKAIVSLKWTVQEMEERYRAMSKLGVRNIEGYNARLREASRKGEVLMRKVQTGFDPDSGKPVYEEQPLDLTELPYIVVIVDEFADLMLVAGKDVEAAIQRLAQMARAAGIHLIMATQRPSVDVITGVIKANFPTRISFAVTSKIDSRTILGDGGAEQLLGMGDMLYMAPGGRITRVHGPFVSDKDVESAVTYLKAQGEPAYIDSITEGGFEEGSDIMGALFGEGGDGSGVDELYDQAVAIVARERKASTSFIQRHLQIGYNRAARIIEEMERQGVISKATPTGKREVLVGDYSEA